MRNHITPRRQRYHDMSRVHDHFGDRAVLHFTNLLSTTTTISNPAFALPKDPVWTHSSLHMSVGRVVRSTDFPCLDSVWMEGVGVNGGWWMVDDGGVAINTPRWIHNG